MTETTPFYNYRVVRHGYGASEIRKVYYSNGEHWDCAVVKTERLPPIIGPNKEETLDMLMEIYTSARNYPELRYSYLPEGEQ